MLAESEGANVMFGSSAPSDAVKHFEATMWNPVAAAEMTSVNLLVRKLGAEGYGKRSVLASFGQPPWRTLDAAVDHPKLVRRTGPEHGASGLLSVSLSRTDQRLAVVRKDGTIAAADLAFGTAPDRLLDLGTDNLLATYSANGRLLFVAKRSGEILVWDTAQRQALSRLPVTAPAVFCQTSQDGQRVLVMDKANRTSVWRTADWRETVHWRVERADCCALSPDGSLLATAREKGLVSFWDTSTGKELGTVTHIKEDTTSLAFSPNGRWLAAGSDAGPVTVWELGSRRPVAVLSGHLLSTTALAFSPDSQRLATGSPDKDAVKLWDTGTWQELLTLEVPGGSLSELAFTSDGTRLLARTQSGDLLVWTAPLRTLP